MCHRYTTYKTVVILQLVKLGYMFRLLPGHHQANKEIVGTFISFTNGIPLFTLNFKLLEYSLMVKKLLNLKLLINNNCNFRVNSF